MAGHATGEEFPVIVFKRTQAGVNELALGDDDDIEPIRDLVPTENLSNQSFRSVSLDRATELFGGGDTQPPDAAVRQQEHRAVAAVNPKSTAVDLLEL